MLSNTVLKDNFNFCFCWCHFFFFFSWCFYYKINTNTQEIRGSDSWNFETLKYTILNESNDILLYSTYDPDLHSFSKSVKNLDKEYVLPEDFLGKPVTGYFLIVHLNILSIKKTFQSLWFSETWCNDLDNFIYALPNYTSTHQKKSDCKGGGVSV